MSDPFDRDRIDRDAELVQNLRYLGAVDLRRPKRRYGFEGRLERADERPRTAEGSYVGDRCDEDYWDRRS